MPRERMRRRLIVDRYHLIHCIRFNIFALVVTMLTTAILILPLYVRMTESGQHEDAEIAAQFLIFAIQKVFPLFVLLAVCIVVIELVYSHRFFGPLRRVSIWFGHLKSRDISERPGFRRKDFLGHLSQEYNEGLRAIRESIEAAKASAAEASSADTLEEAREAIARVSASLDALKIDPDPE